MYDAEVSRELISRVTDSVLADMEAWRQRPLDRIYPVLFIDALVMKIRQGQVANRPVYIVVGISLDGERDVLGMWAGTGGEGATQWAAYLTELRNRGVADVFMVCSDGLKGMTDAIEQVWPHLEGLRVRTLRHHGNAGDLDTFPPPTVNPGCRRPSRRIIGTWSVESAWGRCCPPCELPAGVLRVVTISGRRLHSVEHKPRRDGSGFSQRSCHAAVEAAWSRRGGCPRR